MTSRIKVFYVPRPIGKRRQAGPRSREEEKPHRPGAITRRAASGHRKRASLQSSPVIFSGRPCSVLIRHEVMRINTHFGHSDIVLIDLVSKPVEENEQLAAIDA